jgi:Uma2 family endonuclease
MFPKAGASLRHNKIKVNLIYEITNRLKGGPCRVYAADQRVKVERTGLYTYPDILIVCGRPAVDPEHQDTIYNPQVIIEILSKSTESYDRSKKFLHYRRIPSLKEYVLVSQDQKLIERFVRQPDDDWLLTTFDDPEGDFALSTAPVRVPMADVYRDVELSEETSS